MSSEQDFLHRAGWANAHRHDFPADWSTRNFARLTRDSKTAILMISVPDHDPRALAGHKIKDFIALSNYLRGIGVRAPEIYEADEDNGLLLVEDFGDVSLHHVFENNDQRLMEYYLKAADILCVLQTQDEINIPKNTPRYFDSHVYKGRRRLWDWYIPSVYKDAMDECKVESLALLEAIEKNLSPMKTVFLHGDFHPHNLMILNTGDIGVLDFQGGMKGYAPYDLANLLGDARRIVSKDIQVAVMEKILAPLSSEDREIYKLHYALRSFDFHARVIGQAIKLALAGKDKLLNFIPYLEEYLKEDLSHPILQPLKQCLDGYGVQFSKNFLNSDLEDAPKFINKDAF
jgi:aminoglycoside/choline kinase family phosphotransferase